MEEIEIDLLSDDELAVEKWFEDGSWIGSGSLIDKDIDVPYRFHEPEEILESGDGTEYKLIYLLDYD